jgi:hypothetical protein
VTGWHVTTRKKMQRYRDSGCILPPVRFWPYLELAERWARRVGRNVIVKFECDTAYPLPDHKPAMWTPEMVRYYEEVKP